MGATTRLRTLAGAALAVALVAVPLASPAPAATTVRIDAAFGFGGVVRAAAPSPLRVLIESKGFFSGLLRVESQGAMNTTFIERPLEIPGGSRKEIYVLLPRGAATTVALIERNGRIAGRVTPSGTTLTSEPLVGVVSLAPPAVGQLAVPILRDDAKVVAVPRAILDLGAEALHGLSHLVVEADAAAGLSPRQAEAITQFAARGGELIVASPSEAGLRFLPAAWRGTGGGDVRRTEAGAGTVTVALAGFQTSAWNAAGPMWPRVLRAVNVARWSVGADDFSNGEWLNALGQSGRFRRPTLGWLLVFVVGYVALAGPLNFFVLARMKRRELAWITVPALALIFAGAAFLIGRGVRNVPISQGVGVVTLADGGQSSAVALAVLSRNGGDETIHLPAGWLADALLPGIGGVNAPRVVADRRGVDVRFDLSIGAFGTAVARRYHAAENKSAGALTVGSGTFDGTAKNTTSFRFRKAAVVVGSSLQHLGDLDAGGTAPVSVPIRPRPISLEQIFFESGIAFNDFPSGNPEGFLALLRLARTTAGVGEPGRAFLIGTVELGEVGPSLGLGRVPGSVIMVLPLRLTYRSGDVIPNDAIPRALVSTDGQVESGFSPAALVQNAKRSVVRFELPRTARSVKLTTVDLSQIGFGKFGFGGPAFPIEIGPDGQPVARPGDTGPDIAVYDFRRGAWRSLALKDGEAELSSSMLSPEREVLVRMSSDFPVAMTAAGIALRAALA